jgi:modulator of FtsH protease HflK
MSEPNPIPPPPGEDAGSQALAEALRSSFSIVKVIMVLLVLAFLGSGFFKVGPQEKAIILRLGKPLGEGEQALLNPGPHWAFPPPIDEIVRIPFTSVQVADSSIGWMLTPEEVRQGLTPQPMGNSLDPAATSYALTADTNIVHVRATLHYRITDPIHYHFDFSNAAIFVTNSLNNALLFTASQFTVDDLLVSRRTEFKEAVAARVDSLIRAQHLGITLVQLDVDEAAATYLVNKFNEVIATTQKRDTALKLAESYASTTLAEARGTAATRTYVAESARSRLVDMVDAEAKKFLEVRAEYERDPEFFQRIRQMTALEGIYTNAQEKILEPHQNSRELRLNLGREPQAWSTNSVAQ